MTGIHQPRGRIHVRSLPPWSPPWRKRLNDCGHDALTHDRPRRYLSAAVAAIVLATALLPSTAAAQDNGAYPDVPADTYYTVPVQDLGAAGVFDGTLCVDGFCPEGRINRKTMAVWTVRVVDGQDPPAISRSRFSDVDPAGFHARFVERMAELGITTGCGDGSVFCPDGTVTRAQMAVSLSRAFNLADGPDPDFSDVPPNAWYATYVARLAASGITAGCGDGTVFCPGHDTTRAQMAAFLWRADLLARAVALDSQMAVEPLDGPPRRLGLHRFYTKYLDAGGIPIVSGSAVPDEALHAARDIFGEMLSDRPDLSSTMAELGVRVVIMARSTVSSDLPEFPTDSFRDARTRGGGFFADPMVVIAEENLLCYDDDVFPYEDINVHEFAHALHIVGLEKRQAASSFGRRLNAAYERAIAAGLWKRTYAGTNAWEYWAEGVQSWFGLNDPPGPIHNDINTRDELEAYDPNLAALLGEVFGDASVSSSCHETFADERTAAVVQGAITGPDGQGIEGIGIWLWQGTRENSRFGWTDPDGVFTIRVPDGSYRLDVYAAPEGTCAGWYDGDGITTSRSEARPVTIEGMDVTGIRIRLPALPQDLPTIEC